MRMDMKQETISTGGYLAHAVQNKCPICHEALFKAPMESDVPVKNDDTKCRKPAQPPETVDECSEDYSLDLCKSDEPVIMIGTRMYKVSCIAEYLVRKLGESPARPKEPCSNQPIAAAEMFEVLKISNFFSVMEQKERYDLLTRIRKWALEDVALAMGPEPSQQDAIKSMLPALSLEEHLLKRLQDIGAVSEIGQYDTTFFPHGLPFHEDELRYPFKVYQEFYERFRDPNWTEWRQSNMREGYTVATAAHFRTRLNNIWKQLLIIVQAFFLSHRFYSSVKMISVNEVDFKVFIGSRLFIDIVQPLLSHYAHALFSLTGSHSARVGSLRIVQLSSNILRDETGERQNVDIFRFDSTERFEGQTPMQDLGEYVTTVNWITIINETFSNSISINHEAGSHPWIYLKLATVESVEKYMASAPHKALDYNHPPARWWPDIDPSGERIGLDPQQFLGDKYTPSTPITIIYMLLNLIKRLNVHRSGRAINMNLTQWARGRLSENKYYHIDDHSVMRMHQVAMWMVSTIIYLENEEFKNYNFWNVYELPDGPGEEYTDEENAELDEMAYQDAILDTPLISNILHAHILKASEGVSTCERCPDLLEFGVPELSQETAKLKAFMKSLVAEHGLVGSEYYNLLTLP